MKSPTNNWMNDAITITTKKQSYSHERNGQNIQVNHNVNEFNKIFKPYKNAVAKTTKA